jgi:V-type H+-transporting ATPase proteolipid subunit
MSGIIAVYGLVVSVLIAGSSVYLSLVIHSFYLWLSNVFFVVKPTDYSLFAGFVHMAAGLSCGTTGLAAGYAIGYVGDSVTCFHLFPVGKIPSSVLCV